MRITVLYNRVKRGAHNNGRDKRSAENALEMGKAVEILMRSLNENAPLEYVPLKDALDFATSGALELAGAAHKKLHVQASGSDGITVSQLFKFAFYEVLKNSVQYSTSQSVDVAIRALKERSGTQRIEISDSGPGIPDEFKSEVFRPNKTNMTNPGGMGLYIVKKIARIYGGRVWVEDRVHGDYRKGASLVITIPAR